MPGRLGISLSVCAWFLAVSWAQTPQPKTSSQPARGRAAQPAKPHTASNPPRRSPAPSNRTRRTATQRRAPRTPAPARAQLRPTRERYAEIQSALAQAGYYHGPADGDWGPESVNALAYFQREHGLEPTGKIDALSLIQLGLGPKHDTPSEARNTDAGSRP